MFSRDTKLRVHTTLCTSRCDICGTKNHTKMHRLYLDGTSTLMCPECTKSLMNKLNVVLKGAKDA